MKKEFNPPVKMNRLFVSILSILSISILTCSHQTSDENEKIPLILISMDGFRWDYFNKTDTPNFNILISGGAKAGSLVPVFPAKTFPNHITIVTGRHPENHGIILFLTKNIISEKEANRF